MARMQPMVPPLVRKAWRRCVARLLPPVPAGWAILPSAAVGTAVTCETSPSSTSEDLSGISERLFHQFIYERYTEPQRHYHTLEHLEEMLAHLESYEREHGWHGLHAAAMVDNSDAQSTTPWRMGTAAISHAWSGTVLLLSVLFHDVVYDPERNDNEEASASVALEFLKETRRVCDMRSCNSATAAGNNTPSSASPSPRNSFPCSDGEPSLDRVKTPAILSVTKIVPSPSLVPLLWSNAEAAQFVMDSTKKFILATKKHLSVEPLQRLHLSSLSCSTNDMSRDKRKEGEMVVALRSRDDPLHVFLDLDLAILGLPDMEVYRCRYSDNIRREYAHYSTAEFVKGRVAFLESFMRHQQWFKTPYFFFLLEAQARWNAAQELHALTAELSTLTTSKL